MKSKLVLLFFALCILLWPVYAGYTSKIEDGVKIFVENQPFGNGIRKMSRKLTVPMESVFAIELTSNPTTGYFWRIKNLEDLQTLSTNSTDGEGLFIAPQSPPEFAGAPGKQRFFFTAEEVGDQVVKLEYKRPWLRNALYSYYVFVHIK